MNHKILTVTQVAEYLQLSEMATYKIVQQGKLPAFKIGSHWRIDKTDLYEYIEGLKRVERLEAIDFCESQESKKILEKEADSHNRIGKTSGNSGH